MSAGTLRWAAVALFVGAAACAYPRRTTSLSPASPGAAVLETPAHVWRLEVVSAEIPPRKRSGLPWDDAEDSLPDAYVRIVRDGELLYRSPTVADALQPRFDATVPGNLHLPPEARLQVEVWDEDDGLGSDDPIGIWRSRGIPADAVPDGDLRLRLDSGAMLIVRVRAPQPFRGVGISLYEARGESLRLVEIMPESPAGRAGLAPGDDVVALGGRTVVQLGETAAATELSLAAERGTPLTVERDGVSRDVVLDDGYVWPSR